MKLQLTDHTLTVSPMIPAQPTPIREQQHPAGVIAWSAARYAMAVATADANQDDTALETLDRAHDIVRARVDLYLCLIDLGWSTPQGLPKQIARDIRLLAEPTGAAGG
jgi:hypothetical protein